MSKISVAMISYNQERFIAQAVESVLAQKTAHSIELVVGDDCSTDSTRQVLEEYSARFPGIVRLLPPTQNLGMCANVRRTLAACDGDYVALLEGDDYWTDDSKLQSQVEFLESNPGCAIVHHTVSYLRQETGQIVQEFPPQERRLERADAAALAMSSFIQTCAVVFRRSSLPEIGNDFCRLKVGDVALFALVAQSGWIGYIDRNMAVYRVHGASSWSAKTEEYRSAAGHEMERFLARSLRHSSQQLWIENALARSRRHLRLASRRGSFKEFAAAAKTYLVDIVSFKAMQLPLGLVYLLWDAARLTRSVVRLMLQRPTNRTA